jgi:hypothetical protein
VLDDTDLFRKDNLFAESLLAEAQGLIKTLRTFPLGDHRRGWVAYIKHLLITFDGEINIAIEAKKD